MKEIKISKEYSALVDDEDYEELSKYKWKISKSKTIIYAVSQIFMHRLIMKTDKNESIDHIDHNSLNNTKSNLRIATDSQNRQNSNKQKNTTSKFKGVYWNKSTNLWQSNIFYDGKQHYLGRYKNEDDAGRAYDVEAKVQFGKFANLNFKD